MFSCHYCKSFKDTFFTEYSERVLLNSDLCISLMCHYQSKGLRISRYTSVLITSPPQRKYVCCVLISVRLIKDSFQSKDLILETMIKI